MRSMCPTTKETKTKFCSKVTYFITIVVFNIDCDFVSMRRPLLLFRTLFSFPIFDVTSQRLFDLGCGYCAKWIKVTERMSREVFNKNAHFVEPSHSHKKMCHCAHSTFGLMRLHCCWRSNFICVAIVSWFILRYIVACLFHRLTVIVFILHEDF